jgi:glutathione reductase (NADPH)
MTDFDFDLFTIGAGSGGVAASRRAASYGARVAICDDDRIGGTCVIRGCVPKKLLVIGSRYAADFEDARGFGWTVGEPASSWGALIAAKDREIERLSKVYERMLDEAKVTIVRGRAQLVDAHTVLVGDRQYTARYVLVATGARPERPQIPGIERTITSNEALDLRERPARIAIVGGGYIGVELAGVFRSFGSTVTLLVRGDAVLRGFDDDVRTSLSEEMRKRGVVIRAHTAVTAIEPHSYAHRLLTNAGDPVVADVVLYATGRAPNTRALGLDRAGVRVDAVGAVVVDASSRTDVESVYAVGDCTNRKNLTPVAIAEGRAVAETLFHSNPMTVDHTGVASAVFSQPPVGTVGMTERAAREALGDVDVYVSSFRPMKHTLSGRDERTMMKLVVDRKTDRVVGCHMVGDDAPEIIQGVAIALTCGATKTQFDKTIGIHPTAAEELVTMRTKR